MKVPDYPIESVQLKKLHANQRDQCDVSSNHQIWQRM